MKKIFALFLAALLLFSVPASAAKHLDQCYVCFYDAYTYNRVIGASLNFDTLIFELFFNSDDTVYYVKKQWKDGLMTDTGMVDAVYDESGANFTLTMPDNTRFKGYFDTNGSDLWLDFGAGYFRFRPVEPLDLFNDWVK